MRTQPIKIVVTGPESSGKTELASFLADAFGCILLPEYARTYIERLSRPYTYSDVVHIATVQESELRNAVETKTGCLVIDTYLVITKIWFREVFGRMPDWIDGALRNSAIDLFLLCYHDLEWVEDSVRENPGERRVYLFDQYRKEIETLGVPFKVIRGRGKERFGNARRAVLAHFPQLKSTPG
jgi:nicotinamide riboside kinase